MLPECSGVPQRVGPEWSARTRTLSKQDFPSKGFRAGAGRHEHGDPDRAERLPEPRPAHLAQPVALKDRVERNAVELDATRPVRRVPAHLWTAVSGA